MTVSSFKQRFAKTATGALLCLGLTACGFLPAEGPTTARIIGQAGQVVENTPETELDDFVVVTLNDGVIDELATAYHPSLVGVFGTGSPANQSTIGVGDMVQLAIWEAAQGGLFSPPAGIGNTIGAPAATVIPPQGVGRDGTISVPFVGRLRVVGLTPSAVERRVVDQLEGKAIDPQVIATVTNRVSGTVNLISDATGSHAVVLSPAGDRIVDVIARAGVGPAPAQDTEVTLLRGGRKGQVAFSRIVEAPSENIYLRPNDNIFLNAAPKQLSVFGASGLNATIDFGPSGKSLDQVLADAGGLLDLEADPKGVFVMREEKPHLAQRFSSDLTVGPGPVRVIYRADLTNTVSFFHMRDFQMQEGDIVYVATSPSNGLQKFIRLLLGVNTVATVAGGGGN